MNTFAKKLAALWRKLATWGLPSHLDPIERRLAMLTQSAMLISGFAFTYTTLFFLVVGNLNNWLPNSIGVVVSMAVLFINRMGYYKLARHAGLILLTLILFIYGYIWGPNTSLQYLPLGTALLGTILFTRWQPIIGYFALSIANFLAMNWVFSWKTEYIYVPYEEFTYFANTSLLFFIVLGFVLTFRQQQRAYEQNLEKANQQITHSIRYAQRIQNALLGDPHNMIAPFRGGLVLFRPRDLVSGDFFWSAQVGQQTLLVAADCTGHGVPGAFMTVLGTTFLDEIITQNITDPGEVLTALDQKVRRAIASKDSQTADGMDLVVLLVDPVTRQIVYAGAKNPLLRVHKGEPTLIKGNLHPIGGTRGSVEKNYQSTQFIAEPGERIYLYSDGYQDQFGGPEGRKFMSRKFRELLVTNSHLPWPEQENLLNQTLDTWQGTTPQTDDILVIGLEL